MGFLRIGCAVFIFASLPQVVLAATPRIAILEAATNQVPRSEVASLRTDIEDVLRSLGLDVVPFVETRAAFQDDCRDPACMKVIQRTTSASHVMRVEMMFGRVSFTIHLQLWDTQTGRALSSDGKSCDVCTLSDMHAALRERVATLCTRVFQAEPAPPPTTAPAEPLPPAATSPTAKTSLTEVSTAPPSPVSGQSAGRRTGQVAGLALAALGVAAAAYGGYLLYLNGQVVCRDGEPSPCTYHHVTGGRGAAWLLGGTSALFAGGILFYTFTW